MLLPARYHLNVDRLKSAVFPWMYGISRCCRTNLCETSKWRFDASVSLVPRISDERNSGKTTGTGIDWSPHPDLNWRPSPYQGDALPPELCGLWYWAEEDSN